MQIEPKAYYGYDLLHEGFQAFSQIERNGICVDVDKCKHYQSVLLSRIEHIKKKIADSDLGILWEEHFNRDTNYGSGQQLATILFDKMGYEPEKFTASGAASYSEDALEVVDHPTVKMFFEAKKLEKIANTYLKNFISETVDGLMHPFFNLNTVATYRSSSSNPNFQNIPIRDPKTGKILRSLIHAREGNRIVEADYSGIEVAIAACYHRDPVMINYLIDKTTDMHRDTAALCFNVPQNQITKKMRYYGKNAFVFPQFYGSYWKQCAPNLWEGVNETSVDGIPALDYLREIGITKLGKVDKEGKPVPGSFYEHIAKVEDTFWNEKFKIYSKWKKDWYASYLERGFIRSKTGFTYRDVMKRNQAINFPIQGSAFHCLLWTVIHLIKEIKARKMKTKIIGQIHDSVVADVPESELFEYVAILKELGTKSIREVWKWIIIPIEMEIEVTPVNGCWFDKKPLEGA